MRVHGDYYANGYAHLEGLLPVALAQEFLASLRADITASMPMEKLLAKLPQLKSPAVELYGYQYKPMLMFLWGLTPTMREVTGRNLLPTYSYFRAYQRDDLCYVHSDRPACEHSLSMTLAYSDDKPWPLEVTPERGEKVAPITKDFAGQKYNSVSMQPGDAVLYQGVHHRHGRTTPNPNRWSAHMFLHWVDADGPYKEHAFDKKSEQRGPVDFAV